MAAVIMSASLLCLLLLGGLTLVSSQPSDGPARPPSPTVSGIGAHVGFLRSKRANRYLLEEILQGDLERECYEERCTFEEAREYFEDTAQTMIFWTHYYDGDQCDPNPCLHGGNCTDKVDGFSCKCPAPLYGPTCELGVLEDLRRRPPSSPQTTLPEMSECPTNGPAACHQLCTASYRSFTCSCMSGFKLQHDGRSCLPEVKFPCGSLSDPSLCRHGNCPWQASVLNRRGVEVCSGVVLGRRSILTAANCLVQDSGRDLRPSNFYVVPGNKKQLFPVRALYLHNRFHADDHDNDLALLELAGPLPFGPALIHLCLPNKDFSENILMHPGRMGVTKHWAQDRQLVQDLAYMTLDDCRENINISYRLSNKMFCMMRQNRVLEDTNGALTNREGSNQQVRGLGNPNGLSANRNGCLGNTNVALERRRHSDCRRIHNRNQSSETRPLGNGNGSQSLGESSNEAFKNQNKVLGNQIGVDGELQGQAHSQNQTLNQGRNGTGRFNGTSNTQNHGSSRSRVEVGPQGRPLPGSPVATVEQETAFLTGLLISTDRNAGNGAVFIKLSRYLNWIRPRLQASESSVTPQVSLDPERR